MNSLIVMIMLVFLVTGFAYGKAAGTINNVTEAIAAITKTFAGLGWSALPVPGDQSVPRALQLQQSGDDRGGRIVRHHRKRKSWLAALADRLRRHHRRRQPDHPGRDREMGDPGADLRAAVHEAECRAGRRAGRLSRGRLARKRDHAIDGLFRHDRHIRAEVPEGRRRRNGCGDDVTVHRRCFMSCGR